MKTRKEIEDEKEKEERMFIDSYSRIEYKIDIITEIILDIRDLLNK